MLSLGYRHSYIWAAETGWVAVQTQWLWLPHYGVLVPSGLGV